MALSKHSKQPCLNASFATQLLPEIFPVHCKLVVCFQALHYSLLLIAKQSFLTYFKQLSEKEESHTLLDIITGRFLSGE